MRYPVALWSTESTGLATDSVLANHTHRGFGPRGAVDPVRHLIGTAFAFGGNPEKDALYLNVTPAKNDGTTISAARHSPHARVSSTQNS